MAVSSISLPHGTIPTQMFGNVNIQNAMMFINENFKELVSSANSALSSLNDSVSDKADASHDHDSAYAQKSHVHSLADVTGLQSSLDGKAELNHEHTQYLSTLPAHYHDVTQVIGLGEQLQGKAEAVHTHSISDVENLSTEIGTKASTTYVDQQISQLGQTVKTTADQEIEDYGAETEGENEQAASPDVPKDTRIAPQNETVAQKNARVGTENAWARADHVHTLETETDAAHLSDLAADGAGEDGGASFGSSQKVPRLDHSHPLNFPDGRGTGAIAADGAGQGGAASFGDTDCYADLGHSHPLNVAADGTPADTVKSTGAASNGVSPKYARQDHVHKMPALSATDISIGETNVAAVLNNHEDRIEELEEGGGGSGTVKSVDGIAPDSDGNVSLADDETLVQRSMIGEDDGVQGHSAVLDAVADGGHYDTEDGAHEITGGAHYVAQTSQNARILGIAANANAVSARDSIGTDMVEYAQGHSLDEVVSQDGVIDGAAHVKVGTESGKFVKTAADGKLSASNDKVASFASAPSAGKIVITDGTQGELTTVSPYATSPFTVDVVTSVVWNGTQINITGKTLTFTNGVLTGVANKSFNPITTVTYNP